MPAKYFNELEGSKEPSRRARKNCRTALSSRTSNTKVPKDSNTNVSNTIQNNEGHRRGKKHKLKAGGKRGGGAIAFINEGNLMQGKRKRGRHESMKIRRKNHWTYLQKRGEFKEQVGGGDRYAFGLNIEKKRPIRTFH